MPVTLPQSLRDIRRAEIVERVQRDPRTYGNLPLGVDRGAAMEAVGWGQADFDEPVGALSAEISCEDEINLVATSNEFDPEHYRLLQVIDKLVYFECTFCRSYYPKNPSGIKVSKDEINSKENPDYPGKFNQAVAARRGLFTGSTSWRKITAMKKRLITISALSVRIAAASFHRFFRKEHPDCARSSVRPLTLRRTHPRSVKWNRVRPSGRETS